MHAVGICHITMNGNVFGSSFEYGLRPCIAIKESVKIIGGNGEEESPYMLGI